MCRLNHSDMPVRSWDMFRCDLSDTTAYSLDRYLSFPRGMVEHSLDVCLCSLTDTVVADS